MIRKAAEVHRRVRKFARDELLKPGMPLIEICERLENATRVYLEVLSLFALLVQKYKY